MISKVQKSELNQLLNITKSCAVAMIEKGIFQWNEHYPSKEVFLNDIELNQIWKLEIDNEIIGIIVLTEIEDEEYEAIKWLTKNEHNIYIHRLAVHPKHQGKGFAKKLMDFAENYAKENKYKSVRLDTFSKNTRNQQFYQKRAYKKLASIYFPKQSEHPFYCYELVLNV